MGKYRVEKHVGFKFNLYKVYFVVCFPCMVQVNDKVRVSSYYSICAGIFFVQRLFMIHLHFRSAEFCVRQYAAGP